MRVSALLATVVACLNALSGIAAPAVEVSGARIALVVGNGAYGDDLGALQNPVSDARLIARTLGGVGFAVTLIEDADEEELEDAVVAFGDDLRRNGNGGAALFYYAGHGVQSSGANYLIPVDAQVESERHLKTRTVPATLVLEEMEAAPTALNIVVLDACRNNPYAASGRSVGGSRGLARMATPSGSFFLAYSAAEGQVAEDGDGTNSVYTGALAAAMKQPGLELEEVFKRAGREVRAQTGDAQVPWREGSWDGAFHFVSQPDTAPVIRLDPTPEPGMDPEQEEWRFVRHSGDPEIVRSFLESHPSGRFAGAARALLAQLSVWPFTVEVEPASARIRLADRAEPYRAGMMLPAGEYRVEVSASEHETRVVVLRHDGSIETHHVALGKTERDSPPPAAIAPQSHVGSFTVGNRSSQKIVIVRASPTTMSNYGDNKLGTATILSGASHRVSLDEYAYGDDCVFDIFIKVENGQAHNEQQDLCRNSEFIFGGDGDEEESTEETPLEAVTITDPEPVAPLASPPPVESKVNEPPSLVDCATCQPFTVRTRPRDALVQITNIGPRYEPGIKLQPGSYDIRVTADGFDTMERTVRHDGEPTDEWVALPFQDCPVCPKMVELPIGSYTMGTSRGKDRFPDEGPAHNVEIQYRFAVSTFEVSFDEWDACVDDGGCARHLRDDGRGRGKLPAVHLTVADTKAYTNWLTVRTGRPYRLLSEAEWEYAARAGTPGGRHWGAKREDQCAYENGADVTARREYSAWTVVDCSDGYVYAAPSDEERFRSNPWGLHHMLGNVSEWTADCWHGNYVGAPHDGSAWEDDCDRGHVLRGGSWSSAPRGVRAPTRFNRDPTKNANDVGFRVAGEIAPVAGRESTR